MLFRFSKFQFWLALVIASVALVAVIATILATSSTSPTPVQAPQSTVASIAATLEEWGDQNTTYPPELLEELEAIAGTRIVLGSTDGQTIIADSQSALVAHASPPVAADAIIDPLRPLFSAVNDGITHGVQPENNSVPPADIAWLWLDPAPNEPVASTAPGVLALTGIVTGVVVAAYLFSTAVLRPVHAAVDTARQLASGRRASSHARSPIVEMRQLNQALADLDVMLSEAAEKRRALTDDLAHEIRSPLTSALGRLRGVNEGYFEADEQLIEGTISDLELLNQLVGDLRTTTQAEQDTLDLNVEMLDLERAIRQSIDASIPDRDVTLQLEPVQVEVDPYRLQQILRNLLSNADRFSPEDATVEISGIGAGEYVTVTVRDHGPGIADADTERIFERFYRADVARNRSAQSTGLGLTIARALARRHGGDLTALNHADGGAVFTLKLPLLD